MKRLLRTPISRSTASDLIIAVLYGILGLHGFYDVAYPFIVGAVAGICGTRGLRSLKTELRAAS